LGLPPGDYPKESYMMRVVGLLVIVWLIVGAIAAYQRGYFTQASQNCASAGTIAVTVVAGPLNYVGVNPKVDCQAPQPSA
jgi:membrane protein YdbS with pleckstrin-like domain